MGRRSVAYKLRIGSAAAWQQLLPGFSHHSPASESPTSISPPSSHRLGSGTFSPQDSTIACCSGDGAATHKRCCFHELTVSLEKSPPELSEGELGREQSRSQGSRGHYRPLDKNASHSNLLTPNPQERQQPSGAILLHSLQVLCV